MDKMINAIFIVWSGVYDEAQTDMAKGSVCGRLVSLPFYINGGYFVMHGA